MFSFLRWPRRFYVMVRGASFSAQHADSKPLTGFYANRWVDAYTKEEAIEKSFAMVKERLKETRYESFSADVKLEAEEVKEVSLWTERWSKDQGFVFYPDGEEESAGRRHEHLK